MSILYDQKTVRDMEERKKKGSWGPQCIIHLTGIASKDIIETVPAEQKL